jgi:SAM-dependent methyltransferase
VESDDKPTMQDLHLAAQRLAFAPLLFQAARVARDKGVLEALDRAGRAGLTPSSVVTQTGLSLYAVRVLLEACAASGLATLENDSYRLAALGRLVLRDPMTRVNFDFAHDVCFQGAFSLEASLVEGRPAGLSVFGPWPTVYEGLAQLPEQVRRSWFAFDHFYSDPVFPLALPYVFASRPRTLLDVGGNTGKFAVAALAHDPEVRITTLDHPGQLAQARARVDAAGFGARFETKAQDLLDASLPFPGKHDVVWMSQFLDCFSEDEIVHLLARGRRALLPGGRLILVETFWDEQPNAAARACVQATSLYFAAIANGNSRMYASEDLRGLVNRAGLEVTERQVLGFHSLWLCRSA